MRLVNTKELGEVEPFSLSCSTRDGVVVRGDYKKVRYSGDAFFDCDVTRNGPVNLISLKMPAEVMNPQEDEKKQLKAIRQGKVLKTLCRPLTLMTLLFCS